MARLIYSLRESDLISSVSLSSATSGEAQEGGYGVTFSLTFAPASDYLEKEETQEETTETEETEELEGGEEELLERR